MAEKQTEREKTRERVAQMEAAWKAAPVHIKAMAGAYVGPLMAAIGQISNELEKVQHGSK